MNQDVVLKIENLNKHFGITHANKDICLEIKKGEIRGLAGENGSGKSTLLSQIAGIYASDSGTMYKDGKIYKPSNTAASNDQKIAMVVQELGLVGNLPGGVNAYLGKTSEYSKFGFVRISKLYQAANKVTEKWKLPKINFRRLAGSLNVENRKMIELVRALACDPDILILDELTQSLSHDNREVVYRLIEQFKECGRSVILISHDLEETLRISDTISILRDGVLLETVNSKDIDENDLKRKMVGREFIGEYYQIDQQEQYENEIILEARDISTESGLKKVSFEVHKGEILAFCGLSDSGIHDIGKAVYGLVKTLTGEILLTSRHLQIKNAAHALDCQMAYVPKDRDDEALMMKSSVMQNLMLPSICDIKGRWGYLSQERMTALSEEAKNKFNIKCTGIKQILNGLSGGNKQKVNLGRWLLKDLKVLIVDCPTRGVDVGVKAYIYECLKQAKKNGIAIILITDELSEAIGMADNIIVMKNGLINKKIKRSAPFREEEIIEVMV